MNRICVSAVALLVLAGAAHGQVQLRFRTRQMAVQSATSPTSSGITLTTAWNGLGTLASAPATSIVDIAVQARVPSSSGRSLAGFDFDIVMPGEAENLGQLVIARISAAAHTPVSDASAWAIGSSANPGAGGVGNFGVAYSYSYLPGLQAPKFNGSINANSGTFTNNAAVQEIGLIGGLTSGTSLLGTPGIDDGLSGSPATFTGPFVDANSQTFSSPGVPGGPNPEIGKPENLATAALDPQVAIDSFATGQWSDVYHFRYIITSNAQRTLSFQIRDPHASTFTQFVYAGGTQQVWGVDSQTDTVSLLNGNTNSLFTVQVTPTPSTMALMGLGGLMIARRRRA